MAMATCSRKIVTRADLAAASAAAKTLDPLKVSTIPSAPGSSLSSTTDCPNAGKTDSWTLGIIRWSIIASPPCAKPTLMAASMSLTEPPSTIKYLPEQIVRAINTSTEAALSISSSIL